MMKIKLFIAALICSFSMAFAEEGMLIPSLIEAFESDMKARGMKLTAEQIYSINNSSIKDAVIHFNGGCTAEIVSSKALLLTNHHCGFYNIQSHSSLENDYLKNGFWAMDMKDELPNPGLYATRIVKIVDVTDQVNNAKSPADYETIKKAEIDGTHYIAQIKAFDFGNKYYMMVSEKFLDVRLVGAPPSAIGKFGGDTDNWVWPRHTGDFSVFRIYADKNNNPSEFSEDNVPYTPKHFLPVNIESKHKGDFAMIYGFPGRTEQHVTGQMLEHVMKEDRPKRIAMREKTLDIIGAAMKSSDLLRIKYASKQARISNAYKKWIGQIDGLRRLNALQIKHDREKAYLEKSVEKEGWDKYNKIIGMLNDNHTKFLKEELGYLLYAEYIYSGPEVMELALKASKFAEGADTLIKMDKPEFDKQLEALKKQVKGVNKNYDKEVDLKIFEALTRMYAKEIPEEYKPELLKNYDASKHAALVGAKSLFFNQDKLMALLDKGGKGVAKKLKKDPIYKLMMQIQTEFMGKIRNGLIEHRTAKNELMRVYIEGNFEMFPDKKHWHNANSTLRISYGQIEGSEPRDGMEYKHFTTVDGMIDKYYSGNEDFALPPRLMEMWEKKDYGRYAQDDKLWVCFSSSLHTTGGNSGSPVLNAEGHLTGINFDRSWESTMSDFMFDSDRCRNISVDIRYVLWVIEKYAGAKHLVDEMLLITPESRKKMKEDKASIEIKATTKDLRISPENSELTYKRAKSYLDMNMEGEALLDLNQTIRLSPANNDARFDKAQILYDKGDLENSLLEIQEIVKTDRSNGAVFLLAGKIRFQQGDIQMAITNYNISLKEDPYLEEAYLGLGACYIAKGKLNKACESFNKAKEFGKEVSLEHFCER